MPHPYTIMQGATVKICSKRYIGVSLSAPLIFSSAASVMKLGSLVMSVSGSVEGTVFLDFQGVLGNSELELLSGEAPGFVEATGVRCVVANIQKVADVTTASKRVSVLSRIAAESSPEKRPRVVIVGRCGDGCGSCESTYKPIAENAGLVVECASTPLAARALVGL